MADVAEDLAGGQDRVELLSECRGVSVVADGEPDRRVRASRELDHRSGAVEADDLMSLGGEDPRRRAVAAPEIQHLRSGREQGAEMRRSGRADRGEAVGVDRGEVVAVELRGHVENVPPLSPRTHSPPFAALAFAP